MSLRTHLYGVGANYDDDFWAYRPADFKAEEESGDVAWTGGELNFIPSRAHAARPMTPLSPALETLLDHAWKSAKKPDSAPGPITLAASRGSHQPGAAVQVGVYKPIPVTKSPAFAVQVGAAPHLKTGFARDWDLQRDIPRVHAYTFRGDTRNPKEIKKAGGFLPPITRTDAYYMENVVYKQFNQYLQSKVGMSISYADFQKCVNQSMDTGLRTLFVHYGIWRACVEQEALHLGRMLAEEALKGFISTSRATKVAKGFAKANGWVYVLFLNGGYVVPKKGTSAWTTIFGEQEIAMPESVPWEAIMGFRQTDAGKKFTGPIYLRDTFEASESAAAQQCYELLSGKKQ
jgi:hypothetical protein